jgi:dipeptidyl aminopeptidase/acylaminoacyl peptidase
VEPSSSSSTTSSSSPSPTSEGDYGWSANVKSHAIPSGIRAVSPAGDKYAAVVDQKLCIAQWSGGDQGCPIDLPGDLDLLFAAFSDAGSQLAVILTKGGESVVWIVDVESGRAEVLTSSGLAEDATAATTVSVSSAVWGAAGKTFLVQLNPAEGAATGDLMAVPVDGGAPVSRPVPADVAGSSPQMWAVESGVLYAPNTGPATGQLWLLNSDLEVAQVGTGSFSEGGTVLLLGVAPAGDTAMICPANGADIGELEQIDLSTGHVTDYLEDHECDAAAYSPDGRYVVVAGAVDDKYVVTVFENDSDATAVLASERLVGPARQTPAMLTWNADNLLTVTPADLTDADAVINIVQLGTN